jgi:pyocin large subunit-like protein
MIKNVYWSSCEVSGFFLSDFNKTLNSTNRFFKNNQEPNFMKIRPVREELFYADDRTDEEMKT